MTDDRIAWLNAQIDDDDEAARSAAGIRANVVAVDQRQADLAAAHALRHDPARVLREVAFKRRILDIHRRRVDVFGEPGGTFDNCCDGCGYGGICDDPNVEHINDCPELRGLFAVYADRPGYRPEWWAQ